MNVDVEAMQRRIAELERTAASLAARQDPSVRAEFDELVGTLLKTARILLCAIDSARNEKEED